ncbi:MAG: SUMF1/EgtB/PvdO family nonheme iron enzyme [Verrucomicrobiales bacterium]|nr:SUMF1/EgtB/PvdO family nonheme iron enzyme [Verrucomicrobiales bacterium]
MSTPSEFRRAPWILVVLAWHWIVVSAVGGVSEIPAWAFDRGNAKTFTREYADGGPMIAFGGQSPVVVEYDLEFPVSGNYRLDLRYAAAEARPVSLLMDGVRMAEVCREATGSWTTREAKWVRSLDFYIGAGKHTVRFQRPGDFPHLMALRLASEALPDQWLPARPGARKLDDPEPRMPFEPHRPEVDIAALRLAIQDLAATFGERYPRASEWLRELETLREDLTSEAAERRARARRSLEQLRRDALVTFNPWIDFKRLLLVRRGDASPDLGLPRNWESNSTLPKRGYDDALCALELGGTDQPLTTLYRPDRDVFIGDVDLHFDAQRLLFSSVDEKGRWQVYEWGMEGTARPLTGEQPDVDSYDACYLPDGRILFTSTASFIGVPCVYGGSHVANLYRMDPDGRNIRQLCFDQEHDWCPTLLNNGRVMYTRWEYADTPHSNTRLLFHMNPDGTEQMEFLGSNSYWPNSFFYARPIPGHPTRVIAVVGGHHDNPRMGELVLFDAALDRREAGPAVQRFPGHGRKVEAIIKDGLTLDSWPKFLHPYPVSDKHFLVSCKPNPDAPWGIYLTDVFDNLVPLAQQPDAALFEPIPLRPAPKPPVIVDKVNLERKDAVVVVQDIYRGEGLRGVPRGTVKALRVLTYHFAYQGMGGLLGVVGAEGPWDIKRVLGTVPVYPDGSACFRIPANTPVAVQPLDAQGQALQLMRSWMTGMPGEVVQCVGCHERQNTAPPSQPAMALSQPPAEITPWHGPTRGFSYAREVQPVVDRYCVECHDGNPRENRAATFDLRGTEKIKDWTSVTPGNGGVHAGKFSVGYFELSRHVRRPGIESDYHVLTPLEFHAETTDLVQLLRKGHYGVQLDPESWDRLITWIDLNCPYHGTWGEEIDDPGTQRERRRDLLKRYAGVEDDPEAVPATARPQFAGGQTRTVAREVAPPPPKVEGWPFDAAEAQRRQKAAAPGTRRSVDLGDGLSLEFVLIPAGDFVMGNAKERSARRVSVARAFWMGTLEIDNRTYERFDPRHDSRVEDKNAYQFGIHGYPANQSVQPVVRVSWNEAMAFCDWASSKAGARCSLPTEAQWEYACRAGSAADFFFGDRDADFSPWANLADAKLSEFASDPYTVDTPLKNPTKYDDWIPKETRFNDGALIAVAPGRYRPNPWGLHDMHGNVSEWTRSAFIPAEAGGEAANPNPGPRDDRRVVRGGSWRDLPSRATASFRIGYAAWQRVYNVGFRVVMAFDPEDRDFSALGSE